jgi:hypothetical protein
VGLGTVVFDVRNYHGSFGFRVNGWRTGTKSKRGADECGMWEDSFGELEVTPGLKFRGRRNGRIQLENGPILITHRAIIIAWNIRLQ